MYTEAEALEKWCPYAMVLGHYMNDMRGDRTVRPIAINRYADESPTGACLGSGCMAWRWRSDSSRKFWANEFWAYVKYSQQIDEPPRPAEVPATFEWSPYDPQHGEPGCWQEPAAAWAARRQGYCGLAGVPA